MTGQRIAGLAGLAMAAAVLAPTSPAQAAGTTATASAATYCAVATGAITPGGDHVLRGITATTPPTASTSRWGAKDLLPDGQTKLAGGLGFEVTGNQTGMTRRQYVVLGTELYAVSYDVKGFDADVVPGSVKQTKVGGGWGSDIRYLENSKFNYAGKLIRHNAYAVQGDRILRWTVDSTGWHSKQSYAGFTAVKTMALISQTASYDTFLANTYGGALYTIRIPHSGAPVVKNVRRSTWQGFESMVAAKCGTNGTVLLGIDEDTGAPYLYTLGHANGTATVITGQGRVNRTYSESTFFRYYDDTETYPQLFGE